MVQFLTNRGTQLVKLVGWLLGTQLIHIIQTTSDATDKIPRPRDATNTRTSPPTRYKRGFARARPLSSPRSDPHSCCRQMCIPVPFEWHVASKFQGRSDSSLMTQLHVFTLTTWGGNPDEIVQLTSRGWPFTRTGTKATGFSGTRCLNGFHYLGLLAFPT
jgi:hypothetical protein